MSRYIPLPIRQRGAVLALLAIMLVVLVGIAALALDLGRVLVLRSEMQNAVDAAALAGAQELNGKLDAIVRAKNAARHLLAEPEPSSGGPWYNAGHHALESLLLGDAMPADDEVVFEFFCAIGSKYDLPELCEGAMIDDDGDGTNDKILATSDEDAHYIRVKLLPDAGKPDSYVVPLYFLPVLNFVADVEVFQQPVGAIALAGRHFRMCNYPPIMICDPFENGAAVAGINSFEEAVEADPPYVSVGDEVLLKYQGPNAAWAPGNFAFLAPGTEGHYLTGARDVGEFIASPCAQPCTPPVVRTRPGAVESWPQWGFNTYFEVYQHGAFTPNKYPPGPVVAEYPRDGTHRSWDLTGRFGNGDWDRDGYRDAYHGIEQVDEDGNGTGVYDYDAGFEDLSNMTRWEVYLKEIETGYLPLNHKGVDNVPGTNPDTGDNDDITDPADEPVCVRDDCTPAYTDPWACSSKGNKVPGAPDCMKDVDPDDFAGYPAGYLPDGRPDPDHLNFDGEDPPKECKAILEGETPSTPNSIPERRETFVAVIQCLAEGVSGAASPVVVDTFAKFFIIQRARVDKADNRKFDVFAEFEGLVDGRDAEYHVEVQLYE